MQLLARRLAQIHTPPGRIRVRRRWAGRRREQGFGRRRWRAAYGIRWERDAKVPTPGFWARAAEIDVFARWRHVDQDWGDGRVDSWEGAEEQSVVLRSAVGGCCAGSGVEVGYRRGGEEGVWGEEKGALELGGGGDCLVEGLGDALGEEEFALGEVDEDLFEEFGKGEGADCGGWFEGGHFFIRVMLAMLPDCWGQLCLMVSFNRMLFQSS